MGQTLFAKTNLFWLLCLFAILLSCNNRQKTGFQPVADPYVADSVEQLDKRIAAIHQDQEGRFWFGSTGNGVYRFDGEKLSRFTTNHGLVSNDVRDIQEDPEGNLYFETPEGISRLNGETFSTLEVIASDQESWKLEPGDLWFYCNGNANHVYRYDGEKLHQLKLPEQDLLKSLGMDPKAQRYDPYTVFGINRDKRGNIWFGTLLAGAFRYDGKAFLWIGEKELSRLSDGREPGVRAILEDPDGNFWLSNFLIKYRITNRSEGYEKLEASEPGHEIFENEIPYFNAGLTAANGDLWMTTYGGFVWHYDGQALSKVEIKHGDTPVRLLSIYEDRQGSIWVGTENAGVFRYNVGVFEKFNIR